VRINLVSWLMQCKFMKFPEIMHNIKTDGVSISDNCLITKLCIKNMNVNACNKIFVYIPVDSIK